MIEMQLFTILYHYMKCMSWLLVVSLAWYCTNVLWYLFSDNRHCSWPLLSLCPKVFIPHY